MTIQEKNTHEGHFLYIYQEEQAADLDIRLIESLDNRYLLRPTAGLSEEGVLRFNISGCEKFTDYLINRHMDRTELVGFLAQLKSVIRTLEDHMLTDENILFDPEYVYIDKTTRKVRFIPVCRIDGDFGERLRPLVEKIFCHIDIDDTESLRFAVRLMKTVLEGGVKMHTLMELSGNTQPAAKTGHRSFEAEHPQISQEIRKPAESYQAEEVTVLLSDIREPAPPGPETIQPQQEVPARGMKGFFSNLASRFKDDEDDEE